MQTDHYNLLDRCWLRDWQQPKVGYECIYIYPNGKYGYYRKTVTSNKFDEKVKAINNTIHIGNETFSITSPPRIRSIIVDQWIDSNSGDTLSENVELWEVGINGIMYTADTKYCFW